MDLVYKIYSVYLYDNQLNHDYIILYNRRSGFSGELNWNMPYDYDYALGKIFDLRSNLHLCKLSQEELRSKSISLMESADKKNIESVLIKNNDFLTIEKTRGTHLPNYNGYNIFWNETKSGINIHDWEVAGIWNVGSSTYSIYRIWENKSERKRVILNNKLNQVLL